MVKKGTMGALALFRKYYMEGDSKRFQDVIESIHSMAMANGFAREANGAYMLDHHGNPVFDKEQVHPNCRDATKVIIEYSCGKASQPVEVKGGTGGTRLLFTPDMIAALGQTEVVYEEQDEYGEVVEVRVVAPEDE